MTTQPQSEGLTRAISRVLSRHPLFAVPLMQVCSIVEDTSIPTACTNGTRVRINPTWFNATDSAKGLTTIDERVLVLCHEAAHTMCDHPRRMLKYIKQIIGPDGKKFNPKKFNHAGDLWINKMLVDDNIGNFPKFGGLLDHNLNTELTVEEIYCNLPDDDDDEGERESSGSGPNGNPFDEHEVPDEADLPSEQEVKDAVAQGVAIAKQAGNLPGGWAREFDKLLNPKKPWEEILRSKLTSAIGVEEYTFAKVNRRMLVLPPHMIMPSTTGHSSTAVYVVIDTSGSVSAEEYTRFMSEIEGILTTARPVATRIEFWDTQSGGYFDLEEGDSLTKLIKPANGGGGTNMEAAFHSVPTKEWVNEQEEIIAVCLTDGYTSSSIAPRFPVIWATTGATNFSYGDTVEVDI